MTAADHCLTLCLYSQPRFVTYYTVKMLFLDSLVERVRVPSENDFFSELQNIKRFGYYG